MEQGIAGSFLQKDIKLPFLRRMFRPDWKHTSKERKRMKFRMMLSHYYLKTEIESKMT